MSRMNLIASNAKPREPRVTTAELLEAYARKTTGLRRTERALLEEQIQLEQDGASPDPAPIVTDDAPEQRARELLNGFAPPPLAEWLGNGGETRWIESRRRLADALLAVRAAVDECRAIRFEAVGVAGGQLVSLPSDRGGDKPLLTGAAQQVLEAIAREGMHHFRQGNSSMNYSSKRSLAPSWRPMSSRKDMDAVMDKVLAAMAAEAKGGHSQDELDAAAWWAAATGNLLLERKLLDMGARMPALQKAAAEVRWRISGSRNGCRSHYREPRP